MLYSALTPREHSGRSLADNLRSRPPGPINYCRWFFRAQMRQVFRFRTGGTPKHHLPCHSTAGCGRSAAMYSGEEQCPTPRRQQSLEAQIEALIRKVAIHAPLSPLELDPWKSRPHHPRCGDGPALLSTILASVGSARTAALGFFPFGNRPSRSADVFGSSPGRGSAATPPHCRQLGRSRILARSWRGL